MKINIHKIPVPTKVKVSTLVAGDKFAIDNYINPPTYCCVSVDLGTRKRFLIYHMFDDSFHNFFDFGLNDNSEVFIFLPKKKKVCDLVDGDMFVMPHDKNNHYPYIKCGDSYVSILSSARVCPSGNLDVDLVTITKEEDED